MLGTAVVEPHEVELFVLALLKTALFKVGNHAVVSVRLENFEFETDFV